MTDLETWLIIILVLGVIVSNLAVLKYSAKFKMPQFGKDNKKTTSNNMSNSDKQSDENQHTSQSVSNSQKAQSSTSSKKDDDKDSEGFW
jgi:FtsZ-interacting cell division protein ZipA